MASIDNIQMRLATPDDAPQIQQLTIAAFRTDDSRKDWTGDMQLHSSFTMSLESVLGLISGSDSEYILATDKNDNLLASIAVRKLDDGVARLILLAVDPTHQQGGIGRKVVTYAEDYCHRVWGCKKYGLNALDTRKQLISWYLRCGYHKTGETTSFLYEETKGSKVTLFLVEMEKDLETPVVG